MPTEKRDGFPRQLFVRRDEDGDFDFCDCGSCFQPEHIYYRDDVSAEMGEEAVRSVGGDPKECVVTQMEGDVGPITLNLPQRATSADVIRMMYAILTTYVFDPDVAAPLMGVFSKDVSKAIAHDTYPKPYFPSDEKRIN